MVDSSPIGEKYDFDSIDHSMRDEVFASWEKDNKYYLMINVEVDNGLDLSKVIIRDKIFREELPLAITAIVYGDNLFLQNNKELYDDDIIVKFNSDIKEYEIVIGLKVGRRPQFYNNMIMTFLITENGVKIKGVKTPKV